MILELISFGFKKNNPPIANYLIDVRFLNNPFYVDALRELTGLDKDVIDFFEKDKNIKDFLNKLFKWIEYILNQNKASNNEKIIIAIGCTGGQHRSPYVTEMLATHLKKKKVINKISIYHSELKKYNKKTDTLILTRQNKKYAKA